MKLEPFPEPDLPEHLFLQRCHDWVEETTQAFSQDKEITETFRSIVLYRLGVFPTGHKENILTWRSSLVFYLSDMFDWIGDDMPTTDECNVLIAALTARFHIQL